MRKQTDSSILVKNNLLKSGLQPILPDLKKIKKKRISSSTEQYENNAQEILPKKDLEPIMLARPLEKIEKKLMYMNFILIIQKEIKKNYILKIIEYL